MKVRDDARLRAQAGDEESDQISNAVSAMHERLVRGGKLILFGNGGSATDANDWAIDCVLPPAGYQHIPAVSLSLEPANISAVANDIGTEADFFAAADCTGAAGRRRGRNLDQWWVAQHHYGARRSAQTRNLLAVALLGYDGGEIKRRGLADFPIVVRCDYIPRIQEVQASIYHTIREMLEVVGRG